MSANDLETILLDALEDERKAEATYDAVIEKFGPVRPFINIVQAETRHSQAIERQMHRLGFAIPANSWKGQGSAPASLAEACALAVQAEIENIALYDQLLPGIADDGVQQVFRNLQAASRDNHLPAFRRCAERESGEGGGGRGGPGGRGHGGRGHGGGHGRGGAGRP